MALRDALGNEGLSILRDEISKMVQDALDDESLDELWYNIYGEDLPMTPSRGYLGHDLYADVMFNRTVAGDDYDIDEGENEISVSLDDAGVYKVQIPLEDEETG